MAILEKCLWIPEVQRSSDKIHCKRAEDWAQPQCCSLFSAGGNPSSQLQNTRLSVKGRLRIDKRMIGKSVSCSLCHCRASQAHYSPPGHLLLAHLGISSRPASRSCLPCGLSLFSNSGCSFFMTQLSSQVTIVLPFWTTKIPLDKLSPTIFCSTTQSMPFSQWPVGESRLTHYSRFQDTTPDSAHSSHFLLTSILCCCFLGPPPTRPFYLQPYLKVSILRSFSPTYVSSVSHHRTTKSLL